MGDVSGSVLALYFVHTMCGVLTRHPGRYPVRRSAKPTDQTLGDMAGRAGNERHRLCTGNELDVVITDPDPWAALDGNLSPFLTPAAAEVGHYQGMADTDDAPIDPCVRTNAHSHG